MKTVETVKEIREYFATLPCPGAMEIKSLPEEHPAYVIRIPDGYGVAIEVDKNLEVAERFNSIRLYTDIMGLAGETKHLLFLRSSFEEYRYEFASMCAEFVSPGDAGTNRADIVADPYRWWAKWKDLVGNTNRDQRVYDIIAEMMVLDLKIKTDSTTVWAATKKGSHDIECAEESCEVKSTVTRYGASIIVSGQHQLEHKKPLFIYFCRLEDSLDGVSINELKTQLIEDGYDEGKLEAELEKKGFERGSNIRNKKYKKLEGRIYEVNDSFPRIVKESFKGDKFPTAITHIEYTVDLDGLEYTTW